MALCGTAHRGRDPPAGEPKEDDISPRVREIKKQVEDGTYEVDLEELADRLREEPDRDDPEPS